MRGPRLAIITSHPIQYYAPLFRRLAASGELDIRVFYGNEGLTRGARDPGFAREVQWDVPLLDGYSFSFAPNDGREAVTRRSHGIMSRALVRMVERWRPDALLVVGWASPGHLAAMRAFHGRVPVVFRGDSTLLGETFGPKRWLRRRWLRYVYRHVDLALYVGTHNLRYFRAHGLRSEQLAWAPHAVDNDRFTDQNGTLVHEAAAWRAGIGISATAPTALFVGKLEAKKAPDLLLSSFLKHADPHAHLAFVGSGPLENTLCRAAAEKQNVHFLGFQNQSRMPIAYRLGDVCVLPSRGSAETWGLSVNEAMACGLPVIVSDQVGCAPDLVRPQTGIVFEAEDEAGLGHKLHGLLADADLRAKMGRAGRELIEGWSIDNLAGRMERVVAALCQGRVLDDRWHLPPGNPGVQG